MKELLCHLLFAVVLCASALGENPASPAATINRFAPPAGIPKTEIDGGLTFNHNSDRVNFATELAISGGLAGVGSIGGLAGVVTLSQLGIANDSVATLSNKTVDPSNIISPVAKMFPARLTVEGDSLSDAGRLYWPTYFTGVPAGFFHGIPTSYDYVYSYLGGQPGDVTKAVTVSMTSGSKNFAVTSGSISDVQPGETINFNTLGYSVHISTITDATHGVFSDNVNDTGSFVGNIAPEPHNAYNLKPLTSWPEQLIAKVGSEMELVDYAYAGRETTDIGMCYQLEAHNTAPRFTGVTSAFTLMSVNQLAQADTAAQIYASFKYIAQCARSDGYFPIVAFTCCHICTDPATDSHWIKGGDLDNKLIALNDLIRGGLSDGTFDAVIDNDTIPETKPTNLGTITAGQGYTQDNSYRASVNDQHMNVAGNAIWAREAFNAIKGCTINPVRTAQSDFGDIMDKANREGPWAKVLIRIDNMRNDAAGGGGDYNGEANAGWWAIHTNAVGHSTRFAWASPLRPRAVQAFGNGYFTATRGVMNWNTRTTASISFQCDWGTNTYPNSTGEISFARNGNPPTGLMAAGSYGGGIQIKNSAAGVHDVRAVASDGTTLFTSSVLTQIDNNQHALTIGFDGLGDLFITLDETRYSFTKVLPTNGTFAGNPTMTIMMDDSTADDPDHYTYFTDSIIRQW
jgi:hypothetical protein